MDLEENAKQAKEVINSQQAQRSFIEGMLEIATIAMAVDYYEFVIGAATDIVTDCY